MKTSWMLGVGWLLLVLFFLSFANMMGASGNIMGGGMISYGVFYFLLAVGLMSLMFSGGSKWDGKNDTSDHKNALSILESRYAKGEISKEEFEAKKKDIAK